MGPTRAGDFPGLVVATGMVLSLFFAGNILVWTGHKTVSWAVLGAGFGAYGLVQLYYAFHAEESGSRARGVRIMSSIFTGCSAIAYAVAVITGWHFASSIGIGLAAGGIAAGVAQNVETVRDRRRERRRRNKPP